MAKSPSFFGLRRGSTKSLTFQVLNGRQVTKDRVYDVKNPRTLSQMTTRMLRATASAAYSAMREIVNHSWEGVTYGQPTMSAFVSANIALLKANLSAVTSKFAYNEFQNRGLVPGAYQISKGTLTAPSFTYSASSGEGLISLVLNPTGIASGYTATQLAAALGLSIGEMATICMIFGNNAADGYNFGFVRLKYIASGSVAITAQNLSTYFEIESSLGTPTATVNAANLTLLFENVDINDASAIARGCIYSRSSANGWLRSTTVFTIPAGMALNPTADAALATYPVGSDYILNGGAV